MAINILIVEDEMIIGMDIKRIITEKGYDVVGIAKSCENALQMVKNSDVDLVLMGIMIKGEKDGIETAKIIKDKYDIPVVYVTANNDNGTIERIILSEPYGYVSKPINSIHLEIGIEIAFLRYQMHKRMFETNNKIIGLIREKYPDIFNELNEFITNE